MSEIVEPEKEVSNEGQRLLRLVTATATQEAVAGIVGCTRPNVSYWVNGQSRPGGQARKILHAKYGIHPSAWDRAPGATPQKQNDDPPVISEVAGKPTIELVNSRIKLYAEWVDDVDRDDATRLRAGELERKCIDLRRALERDARAREADIVARSPEWADIRRRLMSILSDYPEAFRAVVDGLGKLVQEQAPAPTEEEIEE